MLRRFLIPTTLATVTALSAPAMAERANSADEERSFATRPDVSIASRR
ncbi:hypothetical protein ACQR1I_13495 [Bradyrhizobium sp. HKCCYLS2038]